MHFVRSWVFPARPVLGSHGSAREKPTRKSSNFDSVRLGTIVFLVGLSPARPVFQGVWQGGAGIRQGKAGTPWTHENLRWWDYFVSSSFFLLADSLIVV
jgi:hypothetical protein